MIGLSHDHDELIARRIGEVAQAARLGPASGQCDVNIMVVITPTPDTLRAAMVKRSYRFFGDGRWPVDKVQLAEFARSDGAAAHVFYMDGESWVGNGATPVDQAGAAPSAPGLSADMNGPPVGQSFLPSWLTPHAEPSLQRVLLVLDARRLTNLPISQVANYASMVSLAEIRISRPMREVSTITTLFADLDSGRAPAADLTLWDRSYLGALYSDQSQADFSAQRSAMSNRIAHAIQALDVTPRVSSPAP